MSIRRVSQVALGVSSLLGVLVACGDSSDSQSNVWVSAYADKASVSLGLYDATGAQVGTCAGTLIGPTTVLTAGHCIAGKTSWQVTASGANGITAKGYRGVTYDWQNFGSNLSHPVHVDLGVVILEKPILLDRYPTLATTPLDDGATASRIRRTDMSAGSTSFEAVDSLVSHGTSKGFAFDYLTDATVNEAVDTGGALIDQQTNIIYGVVSGRGNDSGLMHIARVDVINRWMSNKLLCHNKNQPVMATQCHPAGSSSSSGGSSSGGSSSGGASCGKDAGAGTSSGGTSSGGSSGSSGSSGHGGSSGGSSGGTGGGSPTDCENPSGGGGGGGGSGSGSPSGSAGPNGSGGSSSGGMGGSSGGGIGGSSSGGMGGSSGGSGSGSTAGSPSGSTGSSSGTLGNGGGGGSNNGLVGPGSNGGICWGSCPGQAALPPSTNGGTGGGQTTGSGGSGSGSPAGANGGGGSTGSSSGGTGGGSGSPSGANGSGSGTPAGAGGGSGSGSGAGAGAGTGAGSGSGVVAGTQQNPVPDSTGCVGSICGGCFAACGDNTLDYGDCGCTGTPSSGSSTPIK